MTTKAKRISSKVLEGTIFGKPSGNRALRRERRVEQATDYLNKRPNTTPNPGA